MCVALIGGMDRLSKEYMTVAKEKGHKLTHINRNERNFEDKLGSPDMLIVFTNKISHEAKRKAVVFARSRGIYLRLAHSCGVSTLRECLNFAENRHSSNKGGSKAYLRTVIINKK